MLSSTRSNSAFRSKIFLVSWLLAAAFLFPGDDNCSAVTRACSYDVRYMCASSNALRFCFRNSSTSSTIESKSARIFSISFVVRPFRQSFAISFARLSPFCLYEFRSDFMPWTFLCNSSSCNLASLVVLSFPSRREVNSSTVFWACSKSCRHCFSN